MKSLITKLFTGTITEAELIKLRDYLHKPENQSVLKNYVRDYHDLNLAILKSNVEEAYNKVMHHIESKEKPVQKLFPQWFRYAALAILLLGLAYIFRQDYSGNEPTLIIEDEDITLQLANGDIQIIKEDSTAQILDVNGTIVGTQNGKQLIYNNTTEVKDTLIYNTLNVPYGKRFEIQLSDGTQIHLNAGTSLKYPVKFINGQNRRIFLNGEAFFKVAKDIVHPFIINAKNTNVKVLGTQFNLSAYPEDLQTTTVLIEGSVEVSSFFDSLPAEQPGDQADLSASSFPLSLTLKPGEIASVDVNGKIITKMADTERYIAWMQGKLIFKNIPFKNIIKKLERHYNVTIINNNTELDKQYYDATFDIESIEQVLKAFHKSYAIEYSIKNNQIIIN